MVRIGMDAARFSHWSARQRLAGLKRIIPRKKLTVALRQAGAGETRCGRTPDAFMLLFVIILGLFSSDCYRQIYRWLVPWKKGDVPGRSTLCEARRRLGVRPLVCLANSVVHPLATPETPGAYYAGLRLMSIDGFAVDLPDTPENHRVFGRPRNGRGTGAFPQAQVVSLMESGTHVFCRWQIKGCYADETGMALPLLKHLQSDMLLLWDRGLASFQLVRQVVLRGASLVARWKNNRILKPLRRLSDGSYVARIYAGESNRKADREGVEVRVIEYTLQQDDRKETHRLLTTLLDERRHPAITLVELYHVRWEQEIAIDEWKTHEMERPVLRSQTPAGVVQEIYGLMLAHYIVRALMVEAAGRAGVAPLRMSFTGTLKILRCRLPEYPVDPRARNQWWNRLIEEITEETIPARAPRVNPRVIKKQQSKWPKKRPHHRLYRQPVGVFRDSVVMVH